MLEKNMEFLMKSKEVEDESKNESRLFYTLRNTAWAELPLETPDKNNEKDWALILYDIKHGTKP